MKLRLLPALALLAGASTLTSLSALAPAAASTYPASTHPAAAVHDGYVFATYDDNADKNFNQLLGINDNDEIAGYFGSGTQASPNQGYTLVPPYTQASYTSENYQGAAVQTQVTGLNNAGVTVGFAAAGTGENEGWYNTGNGTFHLVAAPTTDSELPPFNQLLGVNGHDVAVGFYANRQGFDRGYTYDITTGKYAKVLEPGHPGASLTATGINLSGYISGVIAVHHTTEGFIEAGSKFTALNVPGSSSTMALGLNNASEVVGDYTTGSGSKLKTHGFTWTAKGGFVTVDDPRGQGSTTVNGINNEGDLVGFYTVSGGKIDDGFLAIPAKTETKNIVLRAMPAGTVTLSHNESDVTRGGIDVIFSFSDAYGFTPDSAHNLELTDPAGAVLTTFNNPLIANGAGQADESIQTNYPIANLAPGDRVVIVNGTDNSAAGNEPIAATGPIASGTTSYKLSSLEFAANGTSYGTPAGKASLTYDPVAQTLTITVSATGLTPGAHAAHIHVGSCQNQGGVLYMIPDLTASQSGSITGAKRVLTGVSAPIPAAGWYLNLHQGTSANILANGAPTINFRPLLCSSL
jgi:hypothetical protein